MLIVSYDISDDKLRTRFSKFLSRFGYRLQYSVFKIKNSQRLRDNIMAEIEGKILKALFRNRQCDFIFHEQAV